MSDDTIAALATELTAFVPEATTQPAEGLTLQDRRAQEDAKCAAVLAAESIFTQIPCRDGRLPTIRETAATLARCDGPTTFDPESLDFDLAFMDL